MEGCNVWSEQSRVHLDAWMLGCLDAARMLGCLASCVWVQNGYMLTYVLTLPPPHGVTHKVVGSGSFEIVGCPSCCDNRCKCVLNRFCVVVVIRPPRNVAWPPSKPFLLLPPNSPTYL